MAQRKFELVSRAKQENLLWSNVSFILRELQLLVQPLPFCLVSSEIKKYNCEMKKPSRRAILVRASALNNRLCDCNKREHDAEQTLA